MRLNVGLLQLQWLQERVTAAECTWHVVQKFGMVGKKKAQVLVASTRLAEVTHAATLIQVPIVSLFVRTTTDFVSVGCMEKLLVSALVQTISKGWKPSRCAVDPEAIIAMAFSYRIPCIARIQCFGC